MGPKPELPLQYKVIELSTVDESSLEGTVNEWCGAGWRLENVQFAMRESSKRPAMAFVFFTRPQSASEDTAGDAKRAHQRLRELAHAEEPRLASVDPRRRLAQLAGLEEEPS